MEFPDYLNEARGVLEEIFLTDAPFEEDAVKEGLLKLIVAKHNARREGGMSFEEVLLDCVRKFDEKARGRGPRGWEPRDADSIRGIRASEKLDTLAFFLERYDNVQSSFARVVLADIEYSEEWLKGLLDGKKDFDGLKTGLFEELFIDEWLGGAKQITEYGKKKIMAIASGIEEVSAGRVAAASVLRKMKKMAEMERHPFRSSYL